MFNITKTLAGWNCNPPKEGVQKSAGVDFWNHADETCRICFTNHNLFGEAYADVDAKSTKHLDFAKYSNAGDSSGFNVYDYGHDCQRLHVEDDPYTIIISSSGADPKSKKGKTAAKPVARKAKKAARPGKAAKTKKANTKKTGKKPIKKAAKKSAKKPARKTRRSR